MDNLMLDIETLGNREDSLVISIGAVFFDPKTGKTGAEFYRKLNFQDQIDLGRKPTESTVQWWMQQSPAAQNVFHEEGVNSDLALADFRQFILDNTEKCKPWGNGPSFDISIMESLFRDFKIECPWMFFNVRCLRTFKECIYNGKDLVREGIYHHAVDDCKHQIKIVAEGNKRKEVQHG